jgi:hypothetical protein
MMRWTVIVAALCSAECLLTAQSANAQDAEQSGGAIAALVVQHLAKGDRDSLVVVDSLMSFAPGDKPGAIRRPMPAARRSALVGRPRIKVGASRDFAVCRWNGQESVCKITASRLIALSDVVIRGDSAWIAASLSEPAGNNSGGEATRVAVSSWHYVFVRENGQWVMVSNVLTRMT